MIGAPSPQRHLRRILGCFVVLVVGVPVIGLGGAWSLLLVPLLGVAAVALREAVLLRRARPD